VLVPNRFFYFLFAMSVITRIFSQVSTNEPGAIVINQGKPINTWRIYDPIKLTNLITEGKRTEVEKFEAIFSWVANSIDYDYKLYFASGGVYQQSIRRILKTKRGVCLHFATLMDTLCKEAGITNVSIYGYVKDEVFDLGDSIYIDNHVWNAVKLDNRWYLYDITFSLGKPYYRLTKFSARIVRWLNRFTVVYIPVRVKKIKSKIPANQCSEQNNSSSNSDTEVVYVYKKHIKHKILRKLLLKFKLKVVRDFKEGFDDAYYLTQPEIFAITHFPDNPDWSLMASRSMRQYECDSAFYHLNDTVYKKQIRTGRVCPNCDSELGMDPMSWNYHMREKSRRLNPRNLFIASMCEYNIACLKFEEAKKAEDSLSKVTLLDTALAFLDHSTASLNQSYLNVVEEYILQTSKNSRKLSLVMEDNSRHALRLKKLLYSGYVETRNIKHIENKINNQALQLLRRNKRLEEYTQGKDVKKDVDEVEQTIQVLLKEEKELNLYIDSLSTRLSYLKGNFENLLEPLSTRLWQKVMQHDSLLLPLKRSSQYRILRKDNLKKEIVTLCDTICAREKLHSNEVDSLIYKPSAALYETGENALALINERNKKEFEMYNIKRQLVKFSKLSDAELDDYRRYLIRENKEDICWLTGKSVSYLGSVFSRFKALTGKQEGFLELLKHEVRLDANRTRLINHELARRRENYQKIIGGNKSVTRLEGKKVRKYKREYLKTLRKELLEARSKN